MVKLNGFTIIECLAAFALLSFSIFLLNGNYFVSKQSQVDTYVKELTFLENNDSLQYDRSRKTQNEYAEFIELTSDDNHGFKRTVIYRFK